MKIALIDAQKSESGLYLKHWFDRKGRKFLCSGLALPNLAALTPNHEVNLIDEKVDILEYPDADLVGISFKSLSLNHARDIALHYRSHGAKVVCGGIHSSLDFMEVSKFANAVVLGEGESVWKTVVSDAEKNDLKTIYKGKNLINMSNQPIPRFDLINNERFHFHSIQSSRGCSLDCEFCPTKMLFGGVFRTKPIDTVIKEMKTCLEIEKKDFFFVDDIFGAGDSEYLFKLLPEIKKLGVRFSIISDFLVLNEDLIKLLANCGCETICLNMPGSCSLEEAIAIQGIQSLGIDVWGYFMFGFEPHTPDVFQNVIDFVKITDMRTVSLTVMAPFPNTPMFKRLLKEKRIIDFDWNMYDQNHAVHIPANMTFEELKDGYKFALKELNSKVGFPNYLIEEKVLSNV